jgi:hypothetical protein
MAKILFIAAIIFLWYFADKLPFLIVMLAIGLGYLKAAAKNNASVELDDKRQRAYKEMTQLALLALELKQYLKAGEISQTEYDNWQQSIAVRERELCNYLCPGEYAQNSYLEQAWKILTHHSNLNLPEPPWRKVPEEFATETSVDSTDAESVLAEIESIKTEPIQQEIIETEIVIQAPAPSSSATVVANQAEIIESAQPEIISEPFFSVETVLTEQIETDSIFEPETINEPEPVVKLRSFTEAKPPSKLKQLFSKVKNINFGQIVSQIIWPFLWQNIGWFIAGFCIVFGSVYIVAYSSGFFKGLMILLSLSLYSGMLLLCGYQIRLKRPQLYISSYVSVTLAVLLIPLIFTVAANLLATTESTLQLILSLIISFVLILASIYVMQFATGLIERDLPKQYNYFFIGLAAGQYFTPAISQQHWLLLAILHLALASVLIYALQLCNRNWLQEIFLDKHKTSYYLVGTLFYATLVSFIYLTSVSRIVLPAGYYGLCLIIFCAALFYIDRSIQTWLRKPALLNHLSFVIYGLSVVAILIATSQNNWDNNFILTTTLLFSTLLYAAMLWSYLSYPPLYLFLTSGCWLYASFILSYFNHDLYFLLSLPLFYGLKKLYNFALYRQAEQLAVICYRFLLSGIILLLAFSLYSANPSMTAMLTPLMAAVVIYKIISQQEWEESKKLAYFNIGLVTLSAYYTPLLIHSNADCQFSILLIVLAAGWLFLAVKNKHNSLYFDVLLNSVLLSLALSIGLACQESNTLFFPSILIASGIILAATSLILFIQKLFYGFLILLGFGAVLIRKLYFPAPSGLGSIIIVFVLYGMLWFFKYYQMQYKKVDIGKNTLKILGITTSLCNNKIDTCQRPLELSMYLIWLSGLWRIGNNLFVIPITLGTASLVFLAAISTFLISVYSRQAFLFILNILLLFGSLGCLFLNSEAIKLISFSAILLLTIWFSGWYLFNFSSRWLQVITLDKQENLTDFQEQLSKTLHYSIFISAVVCLVSVIATLNQSLSTPGNFLLFVPLISLALFFSSAGYYYQQCLHSYFVISILILIGLLSYGVLFNVGLSTLLSFPTAAVFLLITVAALTAKLHILSLYRDSSISQLYIVPSRSISLFTYTLAIVIALSLKLDNFAYSTPFLLLALLCLPLFPLTENIKLKGFLIPSLLTLFVLSRFNSYLFIGWSFALWILGYYLLPYLNKSVKKDIIATGFCADLGLCLILMNFLFNAIGTSLPNMAEIIVLSTIYSGLMLKHPNWLWLRWTTALGIGMSVLAVLFNFLPIPIYANEIVFGFLASFSIFLFTLYSRQAFLLSVSILLFLASINVLSPTPYFIVTNIFVLVAWFSGLVVFNLTPGWLRVLTLQEKEDSIILQQQLTKALHHTLFFLASGVLFIPIIDRNFAIYTTPLLIILISSAVFFSSAGYYYKQRLHSYFVISILLFIGLLNYSSLFSISLLDLSSYQTSVIWLLVSSTILILLLNLFFLYPKHNTSQLYAKPAQHIAIILCTLCFVLALLIKIDNFNYATPFLILSILYFPLLTKIDNAAVLRGYFIPVLLSLTVLTNFNLYLWAGWSFVLWLLGYYILPYCNKLAKKDLISADFCAVLGLFLISSIFVLNSNQNNWQNITELTVLSTAYLCLMLNYSNWQWLSWITALGINLIGGLLLIDLFSIPSQLMSIYVGIFIWQNLLLMLIPGWNKYFSGYKEDIRACLASPLQLWILLFLLFGLAFVSVTKPVNITLLMMSVGLTISFLHFLWRSPSSWLVNVVLYSFLLSWLLIFPDNIVNISLQAIIWTALLQIARFKLINSRFNAVIYLWFFASLIISLALLIFNSLTRVDWQFIISLVLLIYICYKEWNQKKSSWLSACYVFTFILLHSIWLINADSLPQQFMLSLPYYALQDIALIWLITWLQSRWDKREESTENVGSWLLGAGIVFWFLHAASLLTQSTVIFNITNVVAILDVFLVIGLIIKSYQTDLDKLVYYLAVALAVLGCYLHLCLFGLSGFNIYDAMILLIMSYLLLPLNYKLESHALYKLNFILPLPALLAVSLQPAFNNSLLLLIISCFYLLLPRHQRENSPIFLAVIIFNVGVYLWIPNLATHYGLFSVYVFPASATILLMLQLHSVELKPSLYHSMRLLSLTALYSSVSVDIWLNKEMSLLLFITVLLLTLASIVFGIGLRIRAFLYCGMLFFILNVITQLIYITPENHLTKGIFLFILGGIIFALMVWFQMQRDEILQKVRIFRADLAKWE